MKKMLVILTILGLSMHVRASDLALLKRKIASETFAAAFLEQKNIQLDLEIEVCDKRLDSLDMSLHRLRKNIKKMKRQRHNVVGERKKLGEISERNLVSEKDIYSVFDEKSDERKAANALFCKLREQKMNGNKALSIHLKNIIKLQRSYSQIQEQQIHKMKTTK